MSKWFSADGNDRDVVLASGINLVRNIDKMPFPCRMNNDLRKTACKKVYASIQNSGYAGEFDFIELNGISNEKRASFCEKGYISKELLTQQAYSALLLSRDESCSLVLCGEEHISLNVIGAGENLRELYKKANAIDDMLISNMKIAFDNELGFLTSNPMMLGTGLKASIILHLPAIRAKGTMSSLAEMMSKLGFSIKPLFASKGAFYELSNTISLGITEENAIENLIAISEQIIAQERKLRKELAEFDDFEDKIFRAMGTLKMARKLKMSEFLELISLVRLGIGVGSFELSYNKTDEMMYSLGTATIISSSEDVISKDDAEHIRAQYIRDNID